MNSLPRLSVACFLLLIGCGPSDEEFDKRDLEAAKQLVQDRGDAANAKLEAYLAIEERLPATGEVPPLSQASMKLPLDFVEGGGWDHRREMPTWNENLNAGIFATESLTSIRDLLAGNKTYPSDIVPLWSVNHPEFFALRAASAIHLGFQHSYVKTHATHMPMYFAFLDQIRYLVVVQTNKQHYRSNQASHQHHLRCSAARWSTEHEPNARHHDHNGNQHYSPFEGFHCLVKFRGKQVDHLQSP